MIKRFVCGAAVGAVLLFSGAALSGNPPTTSDDRLMDFNQSTGELLAVPQGMGLSAFIHSPATQHLIADLSKFLPPDPCTPLARVWNTLVGIEDRTGLRFPVVFDILLVLMSDRQCNATITTDGTPSSTAQPMISIAPSGS
jgi:hypothetical protein